MAWFIRSTSDRYQLDPGVDGLKRLRLTPKLFDASHFFSTAAARPFFDGDCDAAAFKIFPRVIPGPPTLWAPRNGKREGRLPR